MIKEFVYKSGKVRPLTDSQRNSVVIWVRLPSHKMKDDLMALAKAGGRSLSQEVSKRLEASVISMPQIEAEPHEPVELVPDPRFSDEDLFSAVKGAETRLGPLTHVSGRTYSNGQGTIVKFLISSPWKGVDNKGYVKVSLASFKAEFIFLKIKGHHRGWLLPTAVVRRLLSTVPVADRSNGNRSWDAKFGARYGLEMFWPNKKALLDITGYGMNLVGGSNTRVEEVVSSDDDGDASVSTTEKPSATKGKRAASDDYKSLLATVHRNLRVPIVAMGSNAVTAFGRKIKISLSHNDQGKDRAFVQIRPKDFGYDWMAVAIKGDPSEAWIIPMAIMQEFLYDKPEKKIGGWNVHIGTFNDGTNRIWVTKEASIPASEYKVQSRVGLS